MLKELDVIALTAKVPRARIFDLPDGSPLRRLPESDEGLMPGDVGTIVCMYDGGKAFEVEFLGPSGGTVAMATVLSNQARPATKLDVTSYRFR